MKAKSFDSPPLPSNAKMKTKPQRLDDIEDAIKECVRFIAKAKKARIRILDDKYALYGSKEVAAMKRSSMDVTRSMAEIRKT